MTRKLEFEDIVNDGAATRAPIFPLEAAMRRFSAECSEKLAGLKSRLTTDLARRFNNLNGQLLWQAVNEAHAIAATTPFPALVLPALAEEKVRGASLWSARQRLIRQRPQALAA